MEMDIAEGKIGEVGAYDVEFKGGKLVAKASAAGGPVEAEAVVKIDAGKVIDAIAVAIPGKVDDAVLALMKQALIG